MHFAPGPPISGDGAAPMAQFASIWKINVPLKIRIFLWQMMRKRLPSSDNIHRRHGPSNGLCSLCGDFEDTNHIFFGCVLARFMWSIVRELLSCTWNPACYADVFRLVQPARGTSRRILWTCFAALCWFLWTTRNKFTIEATFPNEPADCLFKMISYLQLWTHVARVKDKPALRMAIYRLRHLHSAYMDTDEQHVP